MIRTTFSIPDDLLERLRKIAAERHTSIAALIREAVEEKAAAHRPIPHSLGIGASGHRDTAQQTTVARAEPRPWR